MDFIKKHWQKILIIVFVILFMSTCVSNCSHKNEIRALKTTYAHSDSIIVRLQDSIIGYQVEIKEMQRDIKELNERNNMMQKSNEDLNKALNRNVVVNITTNNEEE